MSKICKIYDLQECLFTRIDEHDFQVFNANDNTSMRGLVHICRTTEKQIQSEV